MCWCWRRRWWWWWWWWSQPIDPFDGREDGTGEPCYISDGGDAHLCESCYAACDERELEYLQGEIDYDRSLEWKRTVLSEKENHQHCNICFRAIPAFGQIADRVCYAAEGEYGYLCQECYLRFIKK